MHAWQTCWSPNAAMRQRWQHSPLTPSWMLCMAPGFTAAFARPAGCLCADESSAGKRRIRAGRRSAQRHQHKKALSLIFALQIRESAFVLLTMRLLSQRIRSTPNSEKIIRQPSLFQYYALIGAQRVGGVGVVTQQFLGIGPAYRQGLGNFPLPQVAENQQLRLAVVPAIG